MKTKDKEMKYEQSLTQLEGLVAAIEDPQRDLNGIADDVRKAMDLIRWCREYIRRGEAEMEKLLEDENEQD